MQTPATPSNEIQRQAELCALGVLDTPAEERFDRITRTAQRMYAVPIALISLIDQERQWFKSKQGLDASETGRNISFCGHAILSDQVFMIEDAATDVRFMDNPLVTGAPHIRFYCGFPLHGPNGYRLGTLCLIDRIPRHLSEVELLGLQDLACWAEAELGASYALQQAKDCDARLNNILEHIEDAVLTIDGNFAIKTANPAAVRMFGYHPDELIGNQLEMLIEASHAYPGGIAAAKAQINGREMTGKRSDGAAIALELRISEMLIDRQPCFNVIVREISERKQAQQRLRDSNRLFNSVMDSTASYVHVRDVQGRYLYVNKEYETVFRCRNEEIKGKSYAEVLPPDLAKNVQESERALIDGKLVLRTENLVMQDDGEHTYLVIRSPLFNDDGNVIGTCGVGTDITQLKRLEHEMEQALASLRISEERWSFAFEGSGDGVWDWNVSNSTVLLSKRWKEMLGYQESEIGNALTEWSSRVHPDDMPNVMADVQANLSGETHSFSNEHRVLCKDGSYLWILDRGMVVQRDTNGQPLRMVGTHTDISQRKQMEKIKSEFISTVSHELRTPLTSIRGSLGLLEAGVLGALPAKALDLVKVANKNSQRLITLVNDILDMDKLLSGQMTMHTDTLSLSELVAQAIEANSAYAATYRVSYALAPPPQPCMVSGDADRLMQVMANLLSNAAKFSRPDGVVDIRILPAGRMLRLEVEDRGEGIPPEFQARIFEAFAQADSANTRQQGSTGLGLNISKKLIEKMAGEIGYSTVVGQGTTFWFTLPAIVT